MRLRILATTDMHMHLTAHDYLADRPSMRLGLARTATLIGALRQGPCLLLDNGDFLQGGPMGDLVARRTLISGETHPAIAAMNALGYDAAALGNHDFNFGLRFLRRTVARARFPVLAANLSLRQGRDFAPWCLLRRELTDEAGRTHPLTIAVIGFLPPQTEEWDRDLRPQMRSGDIIDCARRMIPRIRAHGVDLVIALSHSGIGAPDPAPRMEHASLALAALPGIDAVIAGHTHEVFPGPQWRGRPGIDADRGALAGKPAVMPGFGGSHLGVIDLHFRLQDGQPRLSHWHSRAEAVAASIPSAPEVVAPLARDHRRTLRQLSTRVGRCATPLNSHFTVIGHDGGLRLVNMAQRWHVRRRLAGTALAGLPVLAASAPYRAGGRAGPEHFTDIPPGPLTLRHLADLYSFPNRIAAVLLDGAQLREWLERSASIFGRLRPGLADQPLLDPDFPTYNFDVIDGITWSVDLQAPPRFRPDGRLADPSARRVLDLRWQGRPVAEAQRFVLATNSYRLASCGLFSPLVTPGGIVLDRDALTQDVLRNYVRQRRDLRLPLRPNWGFAPVPDASAVFDTGPGAAARPLPDPERLQILGRGATGFLRMRLCL